MASHRMLPLPGIQARLISGCRRRKPVQRRGMQKVLVGGLVASSSSLRLRTTTHLTGGLNALNRIQSCSWESQELTHSSKRSFASASTSTAPSPPTSSYDPAPYLTTLLPFFESRTATTASTLWASRISSALATSAYGILANSHAPKEVLVLRLDQSQHHSSEEATDLLSALLEDGMVDHTGDIPIALAKARDVGSHETGLVVKYGREVGMQSQHGVLQMPLPWLESSGVVFREMQDVDLADPEIQSAIYLAPHVILSCSYSSLFSPRASPRLQHLSSLLRTFAEHPGLRLVISHSGEAATEKDRLRALRQINDFIASSASVEAPRLTVDFVDTAQSGEAQQALREAMGFRTSAPVASSSSSASQDRSKAWSDFQRLSTESGLPHLISSLVATAQSQQQDYLRVLISHAAEEIAIRHSLAKTETQELQSWAHWLETSAQSETSRLVGEILSSIPSVGKITSHSRKSNEPPLLPKWWAIPFIGDVEARERIHTALEREWLGGKETEERLMWWGGRLKAEQSEEQKEMNYAVDSLQKGAQVFDDLATNDDREATVANRADSLRSRSRHLRSLPPSRILELRSASMAYASSATVDLNDPTVLAQPIMRARDHFFGRGHPSPGKSFAARKWTSALPTSFAAASSAGAGAGPSPTEGGVSILDSMQRRIQSTIFRFYATVGLSCSIAGWGLASHELFPIVEGTASGTLRATKSGWSPSGILTDLLSFPSFDPSTSLAIALLGSTYALWALQRSHSRISSRLLTRDVLTRIPANARADLHERVEEVVAGAVFGWKKKIGAIVRDWCELEARVLKEERKSWDSVKPFVLGLQSTSTSTLWHPHSSVASPSLDAAPSSSSSSLLSKTTSTVPQSASAKLSSQQARPFSTSSSATIPPSTPRDAKSPVDLAPRRRDPNNDNNNGSKKNKPPSRHRLYYREVLPAWIKCIAYAGVAYAGCHAAWVLLDSFDEEGQRGEIRVME